MINFGIMLTILSPYLTIVPAVAILYLIIKRKLPVYLNPLTVGLFLLTVISFVSGLLNHSLPSALTSLGILFYLCYAAFLQNFFVDESRLEAFLMIVWKYTLIAADVGIIEKIASFYFDLTWIAAYYLNDPIDYIYRIYSTFGNPNIAGAWFAAMILVGLYFFEKNQYRNKIYYGFGLLILLTALFYSGSRGATIALEAAFVVYAVFTKNKFTRTVLLSSFIVIVVAALLSPELTGSHPVNSRTHIWLKSMMMFYESPILGVGTFGVLDQINKLHSHNIWISFLTLYGISGLCVYLWVKLYLFKSLFILYKHKASLLPLLAAVHAFFIIHGVVDFIMVSPQGGILFVSGAAITVGLARKYDSHPQTELLQTWLHAVKK